MSTPTRTRRMRLERLYPEKSKPRLRLRYSSSVSNSGDGSLVVMASPETTICTILGAISTSGSTASTQPVRIAASGMPNASLDV